MNESVIKIALEQGGCGRARFHPTGCVLSFPPQSNQTVSAVAWNLLLPRAPVPTFLSAPCVITGSKVPLSGYILGLMDL